MASILSEMPIPSTLWRLVDAADPGLFEDYIVQTVRQAFTLFALFLLSSVV